ncbi:MAG: hypothetical protein M3R58_14615 [Pseudomonadota bacterium]|nr:hypothetical protein [Pseudomonadota bacterium]
MSNGLLLVVRLALSLATGAAMVWIGWKLGGKTWALIALIAAAPVLGIAIARPLVEFVHEVFGWLSAQPLKRWEGSYYEFNAVQVRVYEDEGQPWFAAADVMKAAGIPRIPDAVLPVRRNECRIIAGTKLVGFTFAGLEKFVAAHPGPEAGRFLLWAQREVVGPWEKRRAR